MEPRTIAIFTRAHSGKAKRIGKAEVLPADEFSGDGYYIMEEFGIAILVECRLEPKFPLIWVALVSPRTPIYLRSYSELNPHICGKLVGPPRLNKGAAALKPPKLPVWQNPNAVYRSPSALLKEQPRA